MSPKFDVVLKSFVDIQKMFASFLNKGRKDGRETVVIEEHIAMEKREKSSIAPTVRENGIHAGKNKVCTVKPKTSVENVGGISNLSLQSRRSESVSESNVSLRTFLCLQ